MNFKYLDRDYKLSLPQLVLATDPSQIGDGVSFRPGRKWIPIEHQTAGIGCHHVQMVGTMLTMRPATRKVATILANQYYESNAGVFGVSLAEVKNYQSRIAGYLGVDCNNSYRAFEEGIYPIDVEYAQKMTSDKLPKNLDDFLKWDREGLSFLGCIGRWQLYILGENSD